LDINEAVDINQSKQISLEKTTAIIIEDVELYDSRTKRVRLLQANKVQIQINNKVKNSQVLQSQKEVIKEERVIVDTIVSTDSFTDYTPTGFIPLLMQYAKQKGIFEYFKTVKLVFNYNISIFTTLITSISPKR
jgi:hypothetical protein